LHHLTNFKKVSPMIIKKQKLKPSQL